MKAKPDKVRTQILDSTILVFNDKGLKFTMDDVARRAGISKKTIYVAFRDKEDLFNHMVDYCFDSIKEAEAQVLSSDLPTVPKLRRLLGVMPERYRDIDLRKLYTLKDKYPEIFAHVAVRLETDWEPTLALMRKGIDEGSIRPVNLQIFKMMLEASIEQFFQRDILVENGLTYYEGLGEVVDILIDGIAVRN